MPDYYGLIDPDGNTLNQKGIFYVKVINRGRNFILKFEKDMTNAVVLAAPRFLIKNYMFDHECTPTVVSNAPDGNCYTLGFSNCHVDHENMGFSFSIYL